jgi:hypothetical protein
MLSDQFRPFSMTELLIASVQVSADHFARIVFPAFGARRSFSQLSVRGDTITLHQGAGHDRVFVHAWNAPGRKNWKEPKNPSKVKIAKCLSAAPDAACRKEKTGFLPDSTVERRYIDVLLSHLTREYFRPANSVDIHNQYCHGIPAMEMTWRPKSWNLRLFQTVMGKVLVNGLLAFKLKTGQSPRPRYYDARMWWRRRCAQSRRRRPVMVLRAGPELKSIQEYRKARWHHLRRGSNMSWSKAHLLAWAGNGRRDQATCARSVTHLRCASHARQNRILMIQAVSVVFDWHSQTPMP